MTREAAPADKRGRQSDDSDHAIPTCLTMKLLFGMAHRQTTGLVESLLQLIDLDGAVPNFSTLRHALSIPSSHRVNRSAGVPPARSPPCPAHGHGRDDRAFLFLCYPCCRDRRFRRCTSDIADLHARVLKEERRRTSTKHLGQMQKHRILHT
jgi:hypothetical protein